MQLNPTNFFIFILIILTLQQRIISDGVFIQPIVSDLMVYGIISPVYVPLPPSDAH
jgi:hypothetical protein